MESINAEFDAIRRDAVLELLQCNGLALPCLAEVDFALISPAVFVESQSGIDAWHSDADLPGRHRVLVVKVQSIATAQSIRILWWPELVDVLG